MSDEKRQGDPLNLDLIQMVQRGRMQNDSSARPSQANFGYWIESKPTRPDRPALLQATSRAGHFVIPTDVSAIDDLWAKIHAATESGRLGYKSKAATGSRDGNMQSRVLHVCTYDAEDRADVERVRIALPDLGIDSDLHYERNAD